MTKKRVVLSSNNSRLSLGFGRLILSWLLFDRIGISPTAWGVFWTISSILFVAGIADIFMVKVAEISEDGKIVIK